MALDLNMDTLSESLNCNIYEGTLFEQKVKSRLVNYTSYIFYNYNY